MADLRKFRDKLLGVFLVNPSSGKSIPHLDGIRAIAVLLVVAYHSWIISGAPPLVYTVPQTSITVNITPIIGNGYIGVQLFFVLAGFLLSQQWLKADYQGRPRPNLRTYFKLRIVRIAPAYYVCLFFLLLFFIPSLIPVTSLYSRPGLFVLGSHLLFLQYIFPVSSTSYVIDGSLWTLTMEMIFYGVLPFIVVLFLRRRWAAALLASVALSIGWRYLSKHSLDIMVNIYESHTPYAILPEPIARYFLSEQFPTHFASFAIGIGLANVYVWFVSANAKPKLFRAFVSPYMALAYFVIGLVVLYVDMYYILADATSAYYFYEVVSSAGFSLCIAGVIFGSPWLKAVFSIVPLRLIGIVGYSAYLWHLPLIHLFNSYPTISALPVDARFRHVLLLTLISTFLLASVMYLAIEKPFMLLGRRASYAAHAQSSKVAASESVLVPAAFAQLPPQAALVALSVSAKGAHTGTDVDVSQLPTFKMHAVEGARDGTDIDVSQLPTFKMHTIRPPTLHIEGGA